MLTYKQLNNKVNQYGCYITSKGSSDNVVYIRPLSEKHKKFPMRRFATINKWYTNAYVIERPLPNELIKLISDFAETPIGQRQYHFSIDNVWKTIIAETKTYNNQQKYHTKR